MTIPSFDKTGIVKHCFTTRYGGVSCGIYSSMNLGMSRGDDVNAVRENYGIICNALGLETSSLVLSKQIHSDNIITITEKDRGKGFDREGFDDADGLISNVKGITLTAFFADCVPIFLLDPVKKAIGVVHAGWRGTALRIAAKGVERMCEEYGSKPWDILAGIGPSIGKCHYEVDTDVASAIIKACGSETVAETEKNNKFMLDLWQANRLILNSAGVCDDNITIAFECTYCHNDKYFSHRYTGGKRGNLAALIALI